MIDEKFEMENGKFVFPLAPASCFFSLPLPSGPGDLPTGLPSYFAPGQP